MMTVIILILMVLMVFGTIPAWSHSLDWGYRPSGLIGTVLIVLVIMMMLGRF